MNKLAIIGAGGHGKVVAEAAISMRCFEDIVFLDGRYPDLTSVLGLSVVGADDLVPTLVLEGFSFVVAIGNTQIRKDKYGELGKAGAACASVIHSDATVSPSAKIQNGVVIFAGARVNASTTIGVNAIVNTGAIVEHDCCVGDHSHIGPGAVLSGGCTVGDEVLVGAGSVALPGISVGNYSSIGAGGVVVKSVPASVVAKGVPAVWNLK